MSDNSQRLWLRDTQNQVASNQAAAALESLGGSLPCSVVSVNGQIVTVKFELNSAPWTLPQISIPIHTSQYDWIPIQPGDKGMTVAADVYLGGISGIGGGVADTTRRGNLSTLVFVPVSNTSWTAANGNQRIVQGPAGVVIQDMGGNTILTINNTGTVTIKAAHTIIHTLPTSPGASGELWNSSGTVKVS